MSDVVDKLPRLLFDCSNEWRVIPFPEVQAALDRAYLRGERGDALVAAWREAELTPELRAEAEACLVRTAAWEAKKVAAKTGVESHSAAGGQASPGGGGSASPGGGSDAPQKKMPQKKTPLEEDGGPSRGEPGLAARPNAEASAKANRKSHLAKSLRADTALSRKFGEDVMRAGFTGVPNVILQNQKALDLSYLDMILIIHLLRYWWDPAGLPWPSKARLAADVGADVSTVRKRIARMEDLGLVKRVPRKRSQGGDDTNIYDLTGLVERAKQLAAEAAA